MRDGLVLQITVHDTRTERSQVVSHLRAEYISESWSGLIGYTLKVLDGTDHQTLLGSSLLRNIGLAQQAQLQVVSHLVIATIT